MKGEEENASEKGGKREKASLYPVGSIVGKKGSLG